MSFKESQAKLFLKLKPVPYQIANYIGFKFSFKHKETCSLLASWSGKRVLSLSEFLYPLHLSAVLACGQVYELWIGSNFNLWYTTPPSNGISLIKLLNFLYSHL